tara:strand:- start:1146 stop:1748 length:603 start_codon:yes stop_codon:yes gene_type:complete
MTKEIECYCRQYSNWKKNNPKKIVNWNNNSPACQDIIDDYNKTRNPGDVPIEYNTYVSDVDKHCKACIKINSDDVVGEYSANDCVPNDIKVGPNDVLKNTTASILQNEHNFINNIGQKIVLRYLGSEDSSSLLINVDNNLKKNIDLNKKELISKARDINTKQRMLLYDEGTDRLYRMIIFILKFLLLVISIVTIKLIYDY